MMHGKSAYTVNRHPVNRQLTVPRSYSATFNLLIYTFLMRNALAFEMHTQLPCATGVKRLAEVISGGSLIALLANLICG